MAGNPSHLQCLLGKPRQTEEVPCSCKQSTCTPVCSQSSALLRTPCTVYGFSLSGQSKPARLQQPAAVNSHTPLDSSKSQVHALPARSVQPRCQPLHPWFASEQTRLCESLTTSRGRADTDADKCGFQSPCPVDLHRRPSWVRTALQHTRGHGHLRRHGGSRHTHTSPDLQD